LLGKILKWLAPLFTVGVVIFLIFFLISINNDDVEIPSQKLGNQTRNVVKQTEKSWLHYFSQKQQKGYSYPVNEIYIKVDLEEKIPKTITYKLSAQIKDPYELFCLQEELRRHKLKYFLKKDKKGIDLFIYSQNVAKLKKLVTILKNYKIYAHIEVYNTKEDK